MARNPEKMTLSDREETFCHFYNAHKNACKSAEKAGYAPDSACVQGSQLLKLPRIQKRLSELREESYKKLTDNQPFTKEALLDELQTIKSMALEQGNIELAKKAIESQAKILGLDEKKIDITSGGEKIIGINYIMPKEKKDE